MLPTSNAHSRRHPQARLLKPICWACLGMVCSGLACSDNSKDEDAAPACTSTGGPVSGPADAHCQAADIQTIGACVTEAPAAEEGEPEEEEALVVRYGTEADDDDCKYHVEFENSCVTLNEPVTFTVALSRLSNGTKASGAAPANPEIFLADDESHVSPSNDITAVESPSGTYKIGPILFDRSGRWVVRFHYFEVCSDIPEDAPHGHVAFYIDVP